MMSVPYPRKRRHNRYRDRQIREDAHYHDRIWIRLVGGKDQDYTEDEPEKARSGTS